ncbi:GDSL-type esterase/lipase family protein [Planococcus ruber]|uniref:GDSL-type esterase/lipase family protein n=1 Tax=Planococcus ruber TaxID=2027871 RepID=UPI001FED3ECE|nr:GDSL-type esterase/lipase family protein [Planococcus ruber]MCJ1908393.1 GDSL-type esterase/lipase family protein [Planococcus ruber]
MKKIKMFLGISVALNLAFIVMAGFFLAKQGGIAFVKEQWASLTSDQEFPDYYVQKKAIFESLDTEAPDKVFLGDSITDHGEFPEYFPDENVVNRGIAEDTSKGVLNRIDEIVDRHPKEVYIMIGINDIGAGSSPTAYEKNMRRIIEAFDLSETQLVLQSILPINNQDFNNELSNEKVDDFNQILVSLSKEYGVGYVDLQPEFEGKNGQLEKDLTIDGIHLKGVGYDKWIKSLEY